MTDKNRSYAEIRLLGEHLSALTRFWKVVADAGSPHNDMLEDLLIYQEVLEERIKCKLRELVADDELLLELFERRLFEIELSSTLTASGIVDHQ